MKIPLHKPFWGTRAEKAIVHAMRAGVGTADGAESLTMRNKLSTLTGATFAIPVTNCTHAMEAAVAVLGAKTGDEVIVPSFTLSATATAVMIRGARPVYADIDPVTYSLDPADVERRITKKTVGIITVHYAGMAGPNFDALRALATDRRLWIVEDAAHCIGSWYKKKHLGTYGSAGALSFHGTKNVAAGEGGALLTDSSRLRDAMEIFRSIGTDRMAFLAGNVSAYRWVGEGSSFMLSDLLASIINIQLDQIDKINKDRTRIASEYSKILQNVQLPILPHGMTRPNWHIYAIKFAQHTQRNEFMHRMRARGIEVSAHYMPLHRSPMGKRFLQPGQRLPVTDRVADTLVRMPIYAGMSEKECAYVVEHAKKYLSRI